MSKITYPRMHTSLYVSNIKASTNFYTSLFGEDPAKEKRDYTKFELESPALTISFLQKADRVQANFGHMGIQVDSKEELNTWHRRVKEAGLSTLEEIGTSCCYAVQDKFWVADPDGHQWEVYFFHEDSEWNDPKYANPEGEEIPVEAEAEKTCC